jgi:hypothetical protein
MLPENNLAGEKLMAVDWKRLALDPADHGLLERKTLHTRIAKYVAVRREKGEQMKSIVPAAAERFGVGKETIRAAISYVSQRADRCSNQNSRQFGVA